MESYADSLHVMVYRKMTNYILALGLQYISSKVPPVVRSFQLGSFFASCPPQNDSQTPCESLVYFASPEFPLLSFLCISI